ncbi:MAG: hypothetical protein HOH36_03760 [Acidimicrobiaceae bacterium]|nr:hypothetical protein [Acidimicrobiaceae bacterium]
MSIRRLFAVVAVAVGVTGLVSMGLALAAAPVNDSVDNPTPLVVGVEAPWSTIASTDAGETPCDEGGAIWFTFTAPNAGDFLFYTADQTADAVMRLYGSGDDTASDCPAESSNAYDSDEDVAVRTMTAGETVTIRLEMLANYTLGNGWIGVVEVLETADGFAQASTLPVPAPEGTSVIGRSLSDTFTSEVGESTDCGTGTLFPASTWLQFTAQEAASWFIEVTSETELHSSVHRGGTLADSNTFSCATTNGNGHIVDLSAGETVHIRVASDAGAATFSIRARRAAVRMAPEQLTMFDSDTVGPMAGDTESAEVVVINGQPVVLYSDGPDSDLRIIERQIDGTWDDSLVTDGISGEWEDIENFVSALVVDGELMVAFTATDPDPPFDGNVVVFGHRVSDGTWTFETIDTDGEEFYSVDLALINGRPAITYNKESYTELWYAERGDDGDWTAVMVDNDGADDGEDDYLGWQSVLLDVEGSPAIAYLDYAAGAIRWATRSGESWTDSEIYNAGSQDLYIAFDGVIDLMGNPLLIAQSEYSSFTVLNLVDDAWIVENPEHRPEATQLAYAEYAPLQLELTADGRPVFVWYSYGTDNYWYAITEKMPDGTWQTDDAFSIEQILAPEFDPDFEIDPYSIGATMLPDGRFAFAGDLNDNIWYFEDIHRSCPVAASPFIDVDPSSYAVDAIDCIYGLGITTGTSSTTYSPNEYVTREQVAALLARMYRLVIDPSCSGGVSSFIDVDPSSYAADDIGCLHGLGVVMGTSSTTYSPSEHATREQVAALLGRFWLTPAIFS